MLIDNTTASAEVARELYAAAKEKGVDFIDAPVSGGQAGAENGVLTVMCGGDEAVFERARPVIDAYARMRTTVLSNYFLCITRFRATKRILFQESSILARARKTGSNSSSNQELRFSQPLLRQLGCGSGSTAGDRPDMVAAQSRSESAASSVISPVG